MGSGSCGFKSEMLGISSTRQIGDKARKRKRVTRRPIIKAQ